MFPFAKRAGRGRIVLALLILTIAVGALALPSLNTMSDQGVGIVELELARTSDQAGEYFDQLGEDGRDAARESLYLDYPFLIAYGLFFAIACAVVAARGEERGMFRLAAVGSLVIWAAPLAALCDATENGALLRVLDGHTDQPWPALAFGFASAKFLLLLCAASYAIFGVLLTLGRSRTASPAE